RGLVELEMQRPPELKRRVAVAVDVRSVDSLPHLTPVLETLRQEGVNLRAVFLDANTDTLVRRFSETRRPHPLLKLRTQDNEAHPRRRASDQGVDAETAATHALIDTISMERELLESLREVSTVIDTSLLRPAQLRLWVRNIVQAEPAALTLVFESFAYKHGVPMDADFVFDVR